MFIPAAAVAAVSYRRCMEEEEDTRSFTDIMLPILLAIDPYMASGGPPVGSQMERNWFVNTHTQ